MKIKNNKILKNQEKIIEKWIIKNGAASFDLKNRDIILHDGGLFSIENSPEIKGWSKCIFKKAEKRILNGKEQTFHPIDFVPRKYKGKVNPDKVFNFIKNKIKKGKTFEEEVLNFFNKEKRDNYKINLWFEELDQTINYLKRMKRMLNKLGYKTNLKKSQQNYISPSANLI